MRNEEIRKQTGQGVPRKPQPPQRSGQPRQGASADPQHMDAQDEERKVERRLGVKPNEAGR